MIVKDIRTTALSIPFTDPPRWSADYDRPREILVVEIETASGITGMGYLMVLSGGLQTIQACIEELVAPVVLGRSIASVEAIWRDIWRATYWVGRMGVTVFAQSAIDIALWDALGKQAGLPLFQLWGGAGNGDPIPAYGSGCWRGLGREGMIEKAQAYVRDGFLPTEVLARAGRRETDDRLPAIIAGIKGADPDITLQAICERLESMRERTPRGRTRWQPSPVKMLLERAESLGMI